MKLNLRANLLFIIVFIFITLSQPGGVLACAGDCSPYWESISTYPQYDYTYDPGSTSVSTYSSQQTVNDTTTGSSGTNTVYYFPNSASPTYVATIDQVAGPVPSPTPTPTPVPTPSPTPSQTAAIVATNYTTQTGSNGTAVITVSPDSTGNKPIVLEAQPSTDAAGHKTVVITPKDNSSLPQAGIDPNVLEIAIAAMVSFIFVLLRLIQKQKRILANLRLQAYPKAL